MQKTISVERGEGVVDGAGRYTPEFMAGVSELRQQGGAGAVLRHRVQMQGLRVRVRGDHPSASGIANDLPHGIDFREPTGLTVES